MRNKKGSIINKPNCRLYLMLLILFFCVFLPSFISMIIYSNKSEVVIITSALVSVSGGALASVIVAWLIDLSNCKKLNMKNIYLHRMAINDFINSIIAYMEIYCIHCSLFDASKNNEMHNFKEWVELYISQYYDKKPLLSNQLILKTIDDVNRTAEFIYKSRMLLCQSDVMTFSKIQEIEKIRKDMLSTSIFYECCGETPPEKSEIQEKCNLFIDRLSKVSEYKNLVEISFSYNKPLSQLIKSIDD